MSKVTRCDNCSTCKGPETPGAWFRVEEIFDMPAFIMRALGPFDFCGRECVIAWLNRPKFTGDMGKARVTGGEA